MTEYTQNNTAQKKEMVVLLHGILRSKLDMLPLTKFLESHGYDTLNILYPSREKNLEDLSDFVHQKIMGWNKYNADSKLNFVTHSMGGLIARYYIERKKPQNLSKVVMLGPPNTGSEFADWLSETKILAPIFKAVFGPASEQLTTGYNHIDGDITYPLGIIAGNICINPLAPWILGGEHDGIVPVDRTRIKGMSDHIVIPATHTFMMFNHDVMQQVYFFLQHEQFQRSKK